MLQVSQVSNLQFFDETWCTMHAEEALKIGRVGDDDVRIQMHRECLAHPVGQGGGRVARSDFE